MPDLVASQCPAPVVPSTLILLADAYTLPSGNAPAASTFADSNTSTVRPKLNRNATAQDMLGRYGGGGYGIGSGLTLSAPASGLNLDVAAGQAIIDGVVEVAAATTVAIPSSAGRAFIWLLQNGTLTYTLNTTAPQERCCYIGNCLVGGGNILSVDFSGVVYLRGGHLWRETADVGLPDDEPPEGWAGYTRTYDGVWFWDGDGYRFLPEDDGNVTTEDILSAEERLDLIEIKFRALLVHLAMIDAQLVPGTLNDDLAQGLVEA